MPKRLSTAMEAAELISLESGNGTYDVIEIPPEIVDVLTDEDEIGDDEIGDIPLPQDVPGELEVELDNSDEEVDVTEPEQPPASKLSKSSGLRRRDFKWKRNGQLPNIPDPQTPNQSSQEKIIQVLGDASPITVFDFLFEDVFRLMAEQSQIYALQKNVQTFTCSEDDYRIFVGILLLSGYRQVPRQQQYWSDCEDLKCQLVKDAMSKNRFLQLKQFLHLNDNSKIPQHCTDRLYKLRTLLNNLQEKFMFFGIFESCLSIDEKIIQYFGRHSLKQFIRGKPLRFGFKEWALCGSKSSYCYAFDIYQGAQEKQDLPLGTRVVLSFLDNIPQGTELFFDNFFSSPELMTLLTEKGYKATGTLRANRLQQCPLKSDKEIKEDGRGTFDSCYEETSGLIVVRWNDNRVVNLISNCHETGPVCKVKRKSKKGVVEVTMPQIVKQYNEHMGGVDHDNWFTEKYRIGIRGKKWYWPIFAHAVDVTLVNAWILYKLADPTSDMDLLEFRRKVTLALLSQRDAVHHSRKKLSSTPSSLRVPPELRSGRHFISRTDNGRQRRCAVCNKTVRKQCPFVMLDFMLSVLLCFMHDW